MNKTASIIMTSELLESFDQIFHSASRGTHLLFSNRMIRDAFKHIATFDQINTEEMISRLQPVLSDLVSHNSLLDRQDYIEKLDPHLRDLLVHLYFGFLDRYSTPELSPEVFH